MGFRLRIWKKKEPILFFDEVVLYEDELADNGVARLSLKIVRFYCMDGANGW